MFSQTRIVLDALDKWDAETRLSLFSMLNELVRSAGRLVKIFISSGLDADMVQSTDTPRFATGMPIFSTNTPWNAHSVMDTPCKYPMQADTTNY